MGTDLVTDSTEITSSTLTTITSRDSQLSSLLEMDSLPPCPSLAPLGSCVQHDLVPVHNILVQLATNLQVKVDQATREINNIRKKLAMEMVRTAENLSSLGEVKLPSGLSSSMMASASSVSPAYTTILAIHSYRDQAMAALTLQADLLTVETEHPANLLPPEDFNTASDRLDLSFQMMRNWLDQVGGAARKLQNCDGEPAANSLRKFSMERCRDIDSLEREAVQEKMGELSLRSCSIQSRKPVRSLGHTLDLQEIMLLAKNAKSLVYEVSLQMLKIVDLVKGEEIEATTSYHRLTKENSELLRRYCFYLKLKIRQL